MLFLLVSCQSKESTESPQEQVVQQVPQQQMMGQKGGPQFPPKNKMGPPGQKGVLEERCKILLDFQIFMIGLHPKGLRFHKKEIGVRFKN